MEKIRSITEGNFRAGEYNSSFEGIIIVTTKQTINIGISDQQDCCEQAGYVTSEDSFEDFIGAGLLSIEVVSEALERTPVPDLSYEGSAMFVNVNTSKGLFQIVAYNIHNGYYSHEAVVISRKTNHSEYL